MKVLHFACLATLALFYGCKAPKDGFVKTGEVGMDVLKGVNIASSTLKGIELPAIYGIGQSSTSINIPISVNVLEKYDRPVVEVKELVIWKKVIIPENTIYRKVTEYRNGQIVKESEFSYPDKR